MSVGVLASWLIQITSTALISSHVDAFVRWAHGRSAPELGKPLDSSDAECLDAPSAGGSEKTSEAHFV